MQLWQIDIMSGVLLDDGSDLKIVTGIDDHSRFCVAAGLMTRATARAVCEVFKAAMLRYGVPDEVLTDNGKVFTGRFGTHNAEVMFDRMCRENGISHRLIAPRSPTTTGKIERFHQSIRKELLADRSFASLEVAQDVLDAWVADYNNERPHQSLEMEVPAARFRLVPETKDPSSVPVFSEDDQNGQWVLRRVGSNGVVSVDNQMFSVGNAYKGEIVDAFVDDTTIQVWSQNRPHQDGGSFEERSCSQGQGRRTTRTTSGGAKTLRIRRTLTRPTTKDPRQVSFYRRNERPLRRSMTQK
jgi:hypothetical protein